jgi:hypothetical protein
MVTPDKGTDHLGGGPPQVMPRKWKYTSNVSDAELMNSESDAGAFQEELDLVAPKPSGLVADQLVSRQMGEGAIKSGGAEPVGESTGTTTLGDNGIQSGMKREQFNLLDFVTPSKGKGKKGRKSAEPAPTPTAVVVEQSEKQVEPVLAVQPPSPRTPARKPRQQMTREEREAENRRVKKAKKPPTSGLAARQVSSWMLKQIPSKRGAALKAISDVLFNEMLEGCIEHNQETDLVLKTAIRECFAELLRRFNAHETGHVTARGVLAMFDHWRAPAMVGEYPITGAQDVTWRAFVRSAVFSTKEREGKPVTRWHGVQEPKWVEARAEYARAKPDGTNERIDFGFRKQCVDDYNKEKRQGAGFDNYVAPAYTKLPTLPTTEEVYVRIGGVQNLRSNDNSGFRLSPQMWLTYHDVTGVFFCLDCAGIIYHGCTSCGSEGLEVNDGKKQRKLVCEDCGIVIATSKNPVMMPHNQDLKESHCICEGGVPIDLPFFEENRDLLCQLTSRKSWPAEPSYSPVKWSKIAKALMGHPRVWARKEEMQADSTRVLVAVEEAAKETAREVARKEREAAEHAEEMREQAEHSKLLKQQQEAAAEELAMEKENKRLQSLKKQQEDNAAWAAKQKEVNAVGPKKLADALIDQARELARRGEDTVAGLELAQTLDEKLAAQQVVGEHGADLYEALMHGFSRVPPVPAPRKSRASVSSHSESAEHLDVDQIFDELEKLIIAAPAEFADSIIDGSEAATNDIKRLNQEAARKVEEEEAKAEIAAEEAVKAQRKSDQHQVNFLDNLGNIGTEKQKRKHKRGGKKWKAFLAKNPHIAAQFTSALDQAKSNVAQSIAINTAADATEEGEKAITAALTTMAPEADVGEVVAKATTVASYATAAGKNLRKVQKQPLYMVTARDPSVFNPVLDPLRPGTENTKQRLVKKLLPPKGDPAVMAELVAHLTNKVAYTSRSHKDLKWILTLANRWVEGYDTLTNGWTQADLNELVQPAVNAVMRITKEEKRAFNTTQGSSTKKTQAHFGKGEYTGKFDAFKGAISRLAGKAKKSRQDKPVDKPRF